MDGSDKDDDSEMEFYSTNLLATLQQVYGYIFLIGLVKLGDLLAWDCIPPTLGFISPFSFDGIDDQEKAGIHFFVHHLLKDHENMPVNQDDLNDKSFLSLSTLFDWRHITHTPDNWFVFHTPTSSACK